MLLLIPRAWEEKLICSPSSPKTHFWVCQEASLSEFWAAAAGSLAGAQLLPAGVERCCECPAAVSRLHRCFLQLQGMEHTWAGQLLLHTSTRHPDNPSHREGRVRSDTRRKFSLGGWWGPGTGWQGSCGCPMSEVWDFDWAGILECLPAHGKGIRIKWFSGSLLTQTSPGFLGTQQLHQLRALPKAFPWQSIQPLHCTGETTLKESLKNSRA